MQATRKLKKFKILVDQQKRMSKVRAPPKKRDCKSDERENAGDEKVGENSKF